MSDVVKIMYVGPDPDGITIEVPMSDLKIHAPQGEPIEVAESIAVRGVWVDEEIEPGVVERRQVWGGLLDQVDIWQRVHDKPEKRAARATEEE